MNALSFPATCRRPDSSVLSQPCPFSFERYGRIDSNSGLLQYRQARVLASSAAACQVVSVPRTVRAPTCPCTAARPCVCCTLSVQSIGCFKWQPSCLRYRWLCRHSALENNIHQGLLSQVEPAVCREPSAIVAQHLLRTRAWCRHFCCVPRPKAS